ncbi:MAG: hypothetical protein OXB92_13665 [Acidimicrobiaceae bacterium]|nr:hypothetical protein [Acidimicrobiia bacterium]MCY4494896.1 hypothetical protein [Acidimicrobiaceae bacterium]
MAAEPTPDPVLVQRARAQRWAALGQRLGYLLFACSIVVFIFGLIVGFSDTVSRIVIFGVIAGSVVLAPAIIAGYAVKAAVRDDIEHGRPV